MKEKLLAAWNYMVATIGLPVMIVIFLTGSYFVYTAIRDYQTRHAIEVQNAKIDEYTRKSDAALVETNKYLASFAADNLNTMALLDTIKSMSGNIKKLADTDQTVTVRVAPLGTNYENARNQKSSAPAKSRLPVRQREDDVLSADTKLYPPK